MVALIGLLTPLSSLSAIDPLMPPLKHLSRLHLINPGFEWQIVTNDQSVLSIKPAFGYDGSFPETSNFSLTGGFLYDISPQFTIQHLWFYNRQRRSEKGRIKSGNSGNFISLKLHARGPSVASNFIRKSDLEFAIGPTWGIQREYRNGFFLFLDVGPVYYFDVKGNHGFFPLLPRISIGFTLK